MSVCGVISLVREWVWSHFISSRMNVESFHLFVSMCGVIILVRECVWGHFISS